MQGIRRLGAGHPAVVYPRPSTEGIRSTPAAADAARVSAARPATRQPAPSPTAPPLPTRPPDPAARAHEVLNDRIQQASIAALQGMGPAHFTPPAVSLRPAASPRAGGGGAALTPAGAPSPPSPMAHGVATAGVLSILEGRD